MAEKRRFTAQIIAINILKFFFASLFWSVILMISNYLFDEYSNLGQDWTKREKNQMLAQISNNWSSSAIVHIYFTSFDIGDIMKYVMEKLWEKPDILLQNCQ